MPLHSAEHATTSRLTDLPPQDISLEVLLEKYAKGDERSVDDVRRRVARALAAGRAADERGPLGAGFYRGAASGFIPAGRINRRPARRSRRR